MGNDTRKHAWKEAIQILSVLALGSLSYE